LLAGSGPYWWQLDVVQGVTCEDAIAVLIPVISFVPLLTPL
jgi:hypothetical protein